MFAYQYMYVYQNKMGRNLRFHSISEENDWIQRRFHGRQYAVGRAG